MKVQKKVKLGCRTIDLTFVNDIPSEVGEFILGRFSHYENNIKILKKMNPQVTKETILHELMHACLAEYWVEPEMEETIIRLLSPKLVELFHRNPKLLDVIFK